MSSSKNATAAAASVFKSIVQGRRSTRRFQTDRLIPKDTLQDIFESTIRSPSSFNLQPTHIILVQDDTNKVKLSEEAMLGPGNQFRTRDASALAVFISDLEPRKRIERIIELEKHYRHPDYSSSFPMVSSFLLGEGHAANAIKGVATTFLSQVQPMPVVEPVQAWGYKNASLMAQTYCLAAESHGLATCMMEGFDSRRMAEILRIPDRYDIPLVIATGYDYENRDEAEKSPRLDLSEVVFGESFGQPLEGLIDDNDKENAITPGDKEAA